MVVMSVPILEDETVEFEGVSIHLTRAGDGSLGVSIDGDGRKYLLTNLSQREGYTTAFFHDDNLPIPSGEWVPREASNV